MTRPHLRLLASLFLCLGSVLLFIEDVNSIRVQSPQGVVEGFVSNNLQHFLGIPFAEPPVGNRRFLPPQPKAPWGSQVINATSFGPACAQANVPSVNEDCLYLNIIAPGSASPSSKLPVMVWIYGGSFDSGEGAFYDGSNLVTARQGSEVIFVSFNYRVGPFGFMNLPALNNQPGGDGSSGLMGVLDQVLVLQWVQNNIGAFGGDKDKVTLFGESAGGISACILSVLPASAGLFQRVIYESSFCDIWAKETGLSNSNKFVDALGCSHTLPDQQLLKCLQGKDTKTLIAASEPAGVRWFPVVDGKYLTNQPSTYLAAGKIHNLNSVIVGTNNNEYTFFGCPKFGANLTAQDYGSAVYQFFGSEVAPAVLAQYPVSKYGTPIDAINSVFTDLVFRCPSKYLAESLSNKKIPTYMYSFNRIPSFSKNPCLKAAHSFELPFIFPSLISYYASAFKGSPTFNPAENTLSSGMRLSWVTMAKTGDPNAAGGGGNLAWPLYDNNQARFLQLDTPPKRGLGFLFDECDFWKKHPCDSALPDFKCKATPPPPPPPSSSGSDDDDGLSPAAIVGAVMGSVIGAIALLFVVVVAVVYLIVRRQGQPAAAPAYRRMEDEDNL